jgi:AraC family transcriptional regulator, positive regulator of tynA and feaB
MEALMGPSEKFNGNPALEYEEWKVLLRKVCGRYSPEGVEPKAFEGWVRPAHICGLEAVDLGCNAHRIERTYRDVRLDGTDHYGAIFQFAGRSTVVQNDRVIELTLGDIALVDSTQPVTYISENGPGRWLGLNLPRRSLVSHLGLEPEGGLRRHRETHASRLLFGLIRDQADEHDLSAASTEPYMQFAIYDLIGALFAASDGPSISIHSDKLFKRVCGIIKGHFDDPDFGPSAVAAEAGISLRYLQKLFTQRGSTCSHYIHSVRLDHAARLIQRRIATKAEQPLSVIAYTCGFRDYTHFARAFRRRFGHAPGVHVKNAGVVRAGTHEGARSAHDTDPSVA